MGTVRIIHHRNPQVFQTMVFSLGGSVAKDLLRRGKKVESKAKQNLGREPRRVDTGLLRSSINTQLLSLGGKPAVRVGTNVYYAIWVHDGTGIWGPRGTPIVPKTASVLSWKNKKGKRVFAMSSQGMKPNPFLKDAVSAAKD